MALLVVEPSALRVAADAHRRALLEASPAIPQPPPPDTMDAGSEPQAMRSAGPPPAPAVLPPASRGELLAARDQALARTVAAALRGDELTLPPQDDARLLLPPGVQILGALGAMILPGDVEDMVRDWLDARGVAYRVSNGVRFTAAACCCPCHSDDSSDDSSDVQIDPHAVVKNWAAQAGGSGAGVRLGIADSGIDPALVDVQLEAFARFHAGTGALDSTVPADYASSLHGTKICGLAVDRATGVAPDATLLVAAVLTAESSEGIVGTEVQTAAGIDWLVRKGADVVSCSFGAPGWSDAWSKAVANLTALGVSMVAAMGNHQGEPLFPALFDAVVGVGALDSAGKPASWSATGVATDALGTPRPGDLKPDIWMPGDQLPSPVGGAPLSGTSFAAPLYAAAVCRVLSATASSTSSTSLAATTATTQALSASLNSPTPQGATMTTNPQLAVGQEVLPTDTGFRIEDQYGVLVGVLLRTGSTNTWILDSNRIWPNEELTLTVIPNPSQIQLPPTTTSFGAPSCFEDIPTGGKVDQNTPPKNYTERYLIKNGNVTLCLMAAQTTAGTAVLEYGHPAPDNRLTLYGGYRYLPSTTLRLVPGGLPQNVTWSKHRKIC